MGNLKPSGRKAGAEYNENIKNERQKTKTKKDGKNVINGKGTIEKGKDMKGRRG